MASMLIVVPTNHRSGASLYCRYWRAIAVVNRDSFAAVIGNGIRHVWMRVIAG